MDNNHIFLIKMINHAVENLKLITPLWCGYESFMEHLVSTGSCDLTIPFKGKAKHQYRYVHT